LLGGHLGQFWDSPCGAFRVRRQQGDLSYGDLRETRQILASQGPARTCARPNPYAQQLARTVEGEIDNRVLVDRRAAGANLVCAGPEALPLRGDTH